MESNEWPLVAFTITAQLALGMLLVCLGLNGYLVSKAGVKIAAEVARHVVFIAALLLIISLFFSLFHLGTPGKAVKAVRNLGSSWLSREVFLIGAVTAVVCLLAGLNMFAEVPRGAVKLLEWAAAALALILVFCMPQIYLLRTVPVWNRFTTPVAFFSTTLLLGVLVYAVVCVFTSHRVQDSWLVEILPMVALPALFLVGIEFLIIPLGLFMGGTGNSLFQDMLSGRKDHGLMFVLRFVFVYAGMGFMLVGLFTDSVLMVYPAFLLVLAAEVIGRFFFYATYARVGI